MHASPEELAERYLGAVESFVEALRAVPPENMDRIEKPGGWSPRDVAFHAADVDQMLGLRLRRILGEDYPDLAGADTQAGVGLFRRARLATSMAVDALLATSALHTALIENLGEEDMRRKGRHSEGYDVSAADLAAFMAMHVEAHTRQLKRMLRK